MNSTIKSDKDIIQKYKLLIYKIANKIYRTADGISYEDLIQSGYEGLLKAYPAYDKSKGSITTYLTRVLSRAIREEYNNQKNIITIPRNVMDYANHLYKATKLYNNKEEIINYIINNSNLTIGRAISLYNHSEIGQPIRLDEVILDTFNKYYSNLDNELDKQRLLNIIRECIKYLTEREQQIINLHYLEDDLSLMEIANRLNISNSICWGTHKRALAKLRKRVLSKLKRKED